MEFNCVKEKRMTLSGDQANALMSLDTLLFRLNMDSGWTLSFETKWYRTCIATVTFKTKRRGYRSGT